jgi:hypothetical protein
MLLLMLLLMLLPRTASIFSGEPSASSSVDDQVKRRLLGVFVSSYLPNDDMTTDMK